MRPFHFSAIVLVMLFSSTLLVRAADGDPAPEATQGEIRKLLAEYHAAIAAGDVKKALSFCIFKNADEEKVVRLSVTLDAAVYSLHAAAEKKLGDKAWGSCGEILGEMTDDSNKGASITATDDDEVFDVQWYPTSAIADNERVSQYCPVRKTKDGWRFDIFFEQEESFFLDLRKSLRDELAEIDEIKAAILDSSLPSGELLRKRVDKLIREIYDLPELEGVQKA